VVCVAGFASLALPTYTKLNVDSPLAILNDELLELATSATWARVLLVLATLIAAGLLLEAAIFLPRRVVGIAAAVLLTVALPAEAVYAFDRLFAVDGTNGLPVTLDQRTVFGWVDRVVGKDGRVTMLRYPAGDQDYWAGVAYWWDAEFWNESVVDDAPAGDGFPDPAPWTHEFDARTGVMESPEDTQYVLVHGNDVRFRLAGRQVHYERGAYVVEPERPWRADYVTTGVYGDGWTLPRTPAAIRVFAKPGQRTPLRRFLTIALASPDPAVARPVTISSNLDHSETSLPPQVSLDRRTTVCVPPGGSATVEIATPLVSTIYRDPSKGPLTGETDRPAGVRLRWIALADETEPMAACPDEPPAQ
jgi:hypothetical protein